MNPLESRKKLLLAESELNRAQLVQEWHTLAGDVHALTESAKTIGFIASAAASLVAGLATLRQKQSAPIVKKLHGCKPFCGARNWPVRFGQNFVRSMMKLKADS